jgi:hypothetical protein
MAFEKGNKLGQKGKLFDGALKRAIAQDNGERLRQAAEQLLDMAAAGEPWAINTLADRLDGKAAQSVTIEAPDVEQLSLTDLKGALAAVIAGTGSQAGGADEPSQVH